jgi:hypothetical protein
MLQLILHVIGGLAATFLAIGVLALVTRHPLRLVAVVLLLVCVGVIMQVMR